LRSAPSPAAARSAPRRGRAWLAVVAAAGVAIAAAFWALSGSRAPRAVATLDLADIGFGAERSLVRARWTLRGEVQRFGLGVARVDALRECELDVQPEAPRAIEAGSEFPRSFRARLVSARQSQSFVLGTENLLDAAPSNPLVGAIGSSLRYLCAGRGALARSAEHPRIAAQEGVLSAEILELLELRLLPIPARLVGEEAAPEEREVWRLPANAGTLELRWRTRAARSARGAVLPLEAEVLSRWWRAGADRAGAPTRTLSGLARWGIDLARRRFESFELELEGALEPDLGAEPGVRASARIAVELRWEAIDRDAWAARGARSAWHVLARLLIDTFQRGIGS
jgi:hypothetical protein